MMTKSELMENYKIEQLAEMVVELKNQERTSHNYTVFLQSKIGDMESQLDRKQTEINQIDEILNKLFGVTHNVVKTPDEFERILREKADGYKTISDFLPTEPIKIADMLIGEKTKVYTTRATVELLKPFVLSQLRQIAEHLLVYCNANEREGEE